MSATDNAPAEAEHTGHHPQPGDYVRIAVILAVLTAMEISISFIDFGPLGIPLLIALMIIKFLLVAGEFMHLKYDTLVYSRFVTIGLGLAIGLYAIMLLAVRQVGV